MNSRLRRALLSTAALAGLGFFGLVASTFASEMAAPSLVRDLGGKSAEAAAPGKSLAADNRHARAYRVADLFGESDEEKAARLQQEQSQNASINYARQRIQDLESTVRRQTGQIEEQDHRITELNDRIERMQKDFDYRLCTIAQQQLNDAAEGENLGSLPCSNGAGGGGMPAAAPPPSPPAAALPPSSPARASGEPLHLAPPPGNLGTLPANGAAAADAAPPSSANRGKFDSAMKLLAKAQYDEARSAFRAFADNYPQDALAPQAVYWIGDIALVQKDYPSAARAFAEEIKDYPDSARAPDSMVKLGQSLIAMGQKQEGCTALAALPTKYPNASKGVLARAARERKNSGCR